MKRARAGMKRAMLNKVQTLVDKKMHAVYINTIKPTLTADRRVPWLVRVATHEIADGLWENIRIEVVRAFEKLKDAQNVKARVMADESQDAPPHRNSDAKRISDARRLLELAAGDAGAQLHEEDQRISDQRS